MNEKKASAANTGRRRVVQAACAAAYFVLLAVLFVNGKGHLVLIDNKDSPDGSHPALEFAAVGINGEESVEYYPGDRDKASVKGQKHRVRIELEDGTKIEKEIKVPLFQDMVLLSVPLLVADAEGAISPFSPKDVAPPSSEGSGNVNEFTAPMGPGEPSSEPPAPAAVR